MTPDAPSGGREDPLKVLYIIGKGRSGSTILDLVLGRVDGYFSTGELARIWEWGVHRGFRCGCGLPVPECPIWSAVLEDVTSHGFPTTHMGALQSKVLSWKRILRLLRQRSGDPSRWDDLGRYVQLLSHLYRAIRDTTGAEVVVDSTKWPGHPGAFGLVPGITPYVVHLVRDPRAVAHSWRRSKAWTDRDEDEDMPRYGPFYSSASWLARNLVAEVARRRQGPDRSMLVRYEDFVTDPRGTVRSIVDLAGSSGRDLPFLDARTVQLGANHTVGGNPDRMHKGQLTIQEDRGWLGAPRTLRRSIVTVLTFPLMSRYGYHHRPNVPSAG